MATVAASWQPVSGLASGAHPTSTFPNCHLLAPVISKTLKPATWSAPLPKKSSPSSELRQAVHEEDWESHYEERSTKICMRAAWAASEDRCSLLQCLVTSNGSRRVLEIGSFCGVGALAMAESLPSDGQVCVLEMDPFVIEFGKPFQNQSGLGHKIQSTLGPAKESLDHLAGQVKAGCLKPFDLALVDADKEGMQHYFDVLWNTPGLLSERAVVCVDMTPFKGQAPKRYARFGFPYRWEGNPGLEEMNALREAVKDSEDFIAHEVGGLMIVQKRLTHRLL